MSSTSQPQPKMMDLADNQAWVSQVLGSVSGLRVAIDGNQRCPEHLRKTALWHIREAVDVLKRWDGV